MERGASLVMVNDEGSSALHHACRRGRLDVVRYICAFKPEMILENTNGQTAARLAELRHHGEVVNFLKG